MKRKLFFVLFFTALLFCLFTVCASAKTYSGECGATDADNVMWTLDTTTGALVIEGTGAMGNFFEYSSTYAWKAYKNSIQSVVIGNGVTSIGHEAFRDCTNLTSITIPASVTSIGSYAFTFCYKLVQITNLSGKTLNGLPSNPKQEVRTSLRVAFANTLATDANGYITYTVGKTVYFIGYTGIATTLDLSGKGITAIYQYALAYQKNITSIVIPEEIKSIGSYAFRDCMALTEIHFNATTMNALDYHNYAFSRAGRLGEGITVYIGANVTWIPSRLFYPTSTDEFVIQTPKIVSVVFSENSQCISIGSYAFYDCSDLTSVAFGANNQLANIGSYAFYDCSSLTSVTIPASVTSIGNSAFENCTAIDVVYINPPSLSNNFSAFEDLGHLLMHCDTVAIRQGASIPDLITATFPYTESISYLGMNYVAYSVHEHTWESATTYIQCVQDGFRGEQCSVCSLAKGDQLPAHPFGAWQKYTATQHKRVCACTATEYENHNWNNGVITTPATHLIIGVKTYTCTDCGETKTEDIPKLTAHTFGDWEQYNESQHKRVCACTFTEYEDHNWNGGVITTQPTCLELGVKTFTCSDCGETKVEDIPKLTEHSYYAWQKHDAIQHKHVCACSAVEYENHNWSSGVITKKPTNTEVGVKSFTCIDCGEIKTEEIAKTESNPPSTTSSAGQANSANKDNSSNAKEESLGTGAVIGIVGGSVAIVGGGGFCLYWFVFRKKRLLK